MILVGCKYFSHATLLVFNVIWGIDATSHKLSFKHDVTQPAPTVTSQSERNQNVGKYPQNRLSRFGVEIFFYKGAPPLGPQYFFEVFIEKI